MGCHATRHASPTLTEVSPFEMQEPRLEWSGVLFVLEWRMISRSQCSTCEHFKEDELAPDGPPRSLRWEDRKSQVPFKDARSIRVCSAFPDGIPNIIIATIWDGDRPLPAFDHTEPYPGDNGIQYEKRRSRKRT